MSCLICMHLAEVKDDKELPPNESLICHCGRHAKSRMHGFCIPDAIGRCPCVRQRRQCSKRCRCFNCKNNARNNNGTPNGCRCGGWHRCTNDDPNAHAILLVVRAPRTDVNARAAGTRLAKERRARKM